MVRSARTVELDELTAAHGRLEAMGIRPGPGGWVPDGAGEVTASPDGELSTRAPTPVSVGGEAPSRGGAASERPALDRLVRAWAQDRLPLWTHALVDRVSAGVVLSGLLAVSALVVGAAVLLHHGSSGSYAPAASYDASAAANGPAAAEPVPSISTVPSSSSSIVVDVGGRVRKPGLVTLPMGSRVADALAAAGGPLRHKEVSTLDLAARVSDGQLLLIGVRSASATASGTGSTDGSTDGSGAAAAAAPVSLSTATIDELETLPGVGPVTAQKIIDWRTANGGFTSVSQLQQISGIGPSHYAAISPLVTP